MTEIGSSDDALCNDCKIGKYSNEEGRNTSGCIDCPFGKSVRQRGRSNCPDWNDGILYGGSGCVLAFFLVAAFLFYKMKKKVRTMELQVQMTDRFVEHVLNPLEQSKYIIEPSMLKLGKKIGQGGHGYVFKSTLGKSFINTIIKKR